MIIFFANLDIFRIFAANYKYFCKNRITCKWT